MQIVHGYFYGADSPPHNASLITVMPSEALNDPDIHSDYGYVKLKEKNDFQTMNAEELLRDGPRIKQLRPSAGSNHDARYQTGRCPGK